MNAYITLVCVLAVAGLSQASAIYGPGYGWGPTIISAPYLSPAAVSTANMWKGAPIPVIRTVAAAPLIKTVYTAPLIRSIPPISYAPVVKSVLPLSPLSYPLKGLAWGSPYGFGNGWGVWASGVH